MKPIDFFYDDKSEPNRSCLLALRKIILAQDSNITETMKYNMPCFCFKQKMFCYLWINKETNYPYLLLVEGKHLHHPKLETGNRRRMKIFDIDPDKNLPLKDIQAILEQALDLYRKNIINT